MSTPNNPPTAPPQARFFQWMLGFSSILLCRALAMKDVFEQMKEHPCTLEELVESSQLHQDVLFRALRFTTALEVTTLESGRYALTGLGRVFLKDSPGSIYNGLFIAGSEPWQRAWQNVDYCLTTGKDAFEHVMKAPFFDYLEQHPEYGIPFHQQGSAASTIIDPAIVSAYDFTPYRTVCDVGGGQGIFLKEILRANPNLRGILFDQESVVKCHALGEMAGRAETKSGDFFEEVSAADVLILKAVLHDWPDEKCAVILRNCQRAMHPASRLLIVDRVMDEPVDLMNAFYDMHMQVVLNGRERTEAEFSVLLQNAGLQLLRVIPTASPMIPLRIIEASLAG